jgi:glycerophosphoryl diester phosphodiesterase
VGCHNEFVRSRADSAFLAFLRHVLDGAVRWRGLVGATLFVLAPNAHAAGFDLQAHRGGRGLMPENTLAAFENALAMGVSTLELDIAITADGVAVISHDPYLNPALARDEHGKWLSGAGPLIKSLTLAQVQGFDVGRLNPDDAYGKSFGEQQPRDGQRIPTLASLFQRVKELGATEVQFDIETKVFPHKPNDTLPPEEFVKTLLGVIREAGMSRRVMIQSFDWRTLQLVQQMEPGMRTVYLTAQSRSFNNVSDPSWTGGRLIRDFASLPHMVRAAGGTTWSPNLNNIDQGAIKAAQQLGLQVIPWTVNETADMRRLMDWGVDGIITDYPNRLREVLRERALPLPIALKN